MATGVQAGGSLSRSRVYKVSPTERFLANIIWCAGHLCVSDCAGLKTIKPKKLVFQIHHLIINLHNQIFHEKSLRSWHQDMWESEAWDFQIVGNPSAWYQSGWWGLDSYRGISFSLVILKMHVESGCLMHGSTKARRLKGRYRSLLTGCASIGGVL